MCVICTYAYWLWYLIFLYNTHTHIIYDIIYMQKYKIYQIRWKKRTTIIKIMVGQQLHAKRGRTGGGNLPQKNIQTANMTIFQCDKPPYFIFSNATATWEWQLSQHILCIRLEYIQFVSCKQLSQNSAGFWSVLRPLHRLGSNFK